MVIMLQDTTSTERPARRRFWFDARFVIGIVLVLASIAGVWAVVDANDKTIAVYSASATLPAGQPVDTDDLALILVRLGSLTDSYIREGALPEGKIVLTHTVAEGELLPAGAVISADEVGVAPVVVQTTGELAEAVDTGAVVDVWAAEPRESDQFGQPTVIVSGAVVSRVLASDSMVGQQQVSVELLVPKGALATVLSAHANGYAISLIPSAGTA